MTQNILIYINQCKTDEFKRLGLAIAITIAKIARNWYLNRVFSSFLSMITSIAVINIVVSYFE